MSVDLDKMLPGNSRSDFHSLLNEVFSPHITGYNGAAGKFEATVNVSPVLPPPCKGRVPQYSRDKLVELQQKFDDLEKQGVFCRPEDVTNEYLNASFLVKNPMGACGWLPRLVTSDVTVNFNRHLCLT